MPTRDVSVNQRGTTIPDRRVYGTRFARPATVAPHYTASMELRFRAAWPIDEPLTIRAAVDRIDWPSYHVSGAILDSSGVVVTEATARWRVLGDVPIPPGLESVE